MKRLRRPLLIAVRAGLAGAAIVLTYRQLPAIFAALPQDQPLQWWAGRATGFVAYATLALSMVFGLLVSSRGMDGVVQRKTMLEHHQQWTLSAVVATTLHVLIIVTDHYVQIGLRGGFVPGLSVDRTAGVAIGSIALWGLAVLAVSSWLRTFISFGVWRAIHSVATGVFVLGLAHGIVAGTDSGESVAQVLYGATGAAVLAFTVFRVLYEFRQPRSRVESPSTGPGARRPGCGIARHA
jgi:predicted ferric reductase